VEKGRAPDQLLAARIKNDPGVMGNVSFPLKRDDIELTRTIYPYPAAPR